MNPVKTYAGGKPHYIIESDGSYTINCKKGEAKMSYNNAKTPSSDNYIGASNHHNIGLLLWLTKLYRKII